METDHVLPWLLRNESFYRSQLSHLLGRRLFFSTLFRLLLSAAFASKGNKKPDLTKALIAFSTKEE